MCGIIGFSGTFSKSKLISSMSKISHRGPDGAGLFTDSKLKIGFGHCRLSIQDLSDLGRQPMISNNEQIILVFNGEIYNFKELRQELIEKGFVFKGSSDTEVILNLYLDQGRLMLDRLNGIFALAIYDKSTDELLLARDRFGVKPLYYAETDGGFAFASEIKGLLHLIDQNLDLDLDSLYRYSTFLWCPGEGTPIKQIKKIHPGELVIVKSGNIISRETWYQLPIFSNNSSKISINDAISGTSYHLKQAVERQMVSDVPVGAFLSGGLDSSSIVAIAREIDPKIQCFTIRTDGGVDPNVKDDFPFACNVADYLGVKLNVVSINAKKIADDMLELIPKLDEPLSDPAAFNLYYISSKAKEQGISVLLSGTGGDDIFTGYRRHKAIELEEYLQWIPNSIKSAMESFSSKLDQRKPYFRKVAKFFDGVTLEEDERISNYFVWSKRKDLLNLFNADFAACKLNAPLIDFISPLSALSKKPLDKMLALEQRFFLADHNLNYTDKMSMASGVEVRVPFLDNELVEFVSALPLNIRQRKGVGKWILKKSMEGQLPNDVIYRQKTGFGAPLRRWIRFELRELIMDLLSVESLEKRGIFNAKSVHELISSNQAGKVDASYTIFSILCIEIWLRAYTDNSSKIYESKLPTWV